jgi:hypothetical protein
MFSRGGDIGCRRTSSIGQQEIDESPVAIRSEGE